METANAILSFFLPLIVSLVKQSGWDDRINRAIAVLVYLAWAVVVVVASGALGDATSITDGLSIFMTTFITTLVSGTIAYQMIWKAFGVDDPLTAKTSFVTAPVEDVEVDDEA